MSCEQHAPVVILDALGEDFAALDNRYDGDSLNFTLLGLFQPLFDKFNDTLIGVAYTLARKFEQLGCHQNTAAPSAIIDRLNSLASKMPMPGI